jgi:hypothetical protein
MYSVYRVDKRAAEASEQLGTKRKFWFREGDRRMLFKAEERGTGEDWAEKVSCHLCELLGLPHVHYELAEEYDGEKNIQPGVVCETCSPPPMALVLGNQLLMERDAAYPADADRRKFKVREYTVHAVAEVLRGVGPPSDTWMQSAPGLDTALDVFVGYIMLDAWIANQDRHHENWGALQSKQMRLAPTFDHGAALARNLLDDERQDRLATRDRNRTVAAFAKRATSAFFGDESPPRLMKTVEVFRAFAALTPQAAQVWIGRLAKVDRNAIWQILSEVPNKRMSSIVREFTVELLLENHRRLLEEGVR